MQLACYLELANIQEIKEIRLHCIFPLTKERGGKRGEKRDRIEPRKENITQWQNPSLLCMQKGPHSMPSSITYTAGKGPWSETLNCCQSVLVILRCTVKLDSLTLVLADS